VEFAEWQIFWTTSDGKCQKA